MRSLVAIFAISAIILMYSPDANAQVDHKFPDLPYAYNALESFVDAKTMEIHYSLHHRGYYNNFLKAVEQNNLGEYTMYEIFGQVGSLPVAVRNNGGGYYNHNLFWYVMSPNGGDKEAGPEVIEAIKKEFGSMADFKKEFEAAATGRFGSGWAWLSVNDNGDLFVSSTANQDNPLMDLVEERGTPILTLDVWEHAYYLHYQNRRGDYVGNFWKVVNWEEVQRRYLKSLGDK